MKKRSLLIVLTFYFVVIFGFQNIDAAMTTRASSVIFSASSTISTSTGKYGGTVALKNYGSGTITITLQKKNGSLWEDVKSKTKSYTSTTELVLEDTATFIKGNTYRSVTSVDATVDGVNEKKSYYSSETSY